jgi:alanyl-tRNA synthetase
MKSADLRKKYIEFFKERGHVEIPSAPLVPENDPTTLFTSSGMQPLIPYLLGQKHPLGKRLVNSQRSFRAADIDEVGDTQHTTFFEMLGNWSLGDYFKKEQLPWIWEFLTKELGLDQKRLYVSVFKGNDSVPKDTESIEIWKELFVKVGIDAKVCEPSFAKATEGARIFLYDARNNWWSRSGEPKNMPPGEPGGPDSEVFYDFGIPHDPKFGKECHPNCQCGRFMEIANSVFMQYQKLGDGSLKELSQKNVDFGGGLERVVAVTENSPDVFRTDLFLPLIHILEKVSGRSYGTDKEETRAMRIIVDHIKGAVMMMADGVVPSNKTQGYILRRLIRRALLHGRKLNFSAIEKLVPAIEEIYQNKYPNASEILREEALRFGKTLERGLSEIEKVKTLDGKSAFTLYETYGFPWEMTVEIAKERDQKVDRAQFEEEFKKHQALSRTAAKGMFAGGLADNSKQTTRLHTAHHLLLSALQKIVDPTIRQRGSNITVERLRMDFNFARKVTPEELSKVEKLVNKTIKEDLKVTRMEMPREEAKKVGAQMEFGHKYPDKVTVYFVGPRDNYFSAEFCGGPHVTHTGELGSFKILKEESAGSGIRRIYGIVT